MPVCGFCGNENAAFVHVQSMDSDTRFLAEHENGEYRIGLRSISAPVFTVERRVAYTVGVIGMFRSVRSESFAQAIEQVKATAGMISAALGYR